MAKPRTEIPKPSPLQGNVARWDAAEFQKQYDDWLRQHEAAKPFIRLRELASRITEGDKKIGAALRGGKVTPEDARYKEALAKLEGLRAERAELIRTASVPHFAFVTVHNFLRATRGWSLPAGSVIEINLPGVFGIKVDVSETGIPF